MKYISTRGRDVVESSVEAIVNGIAEDSGLYVPEVIPKLNEGELRRLSRLNYNNLTLQNNFQILFRFRKRKYSKSNK